MINFEKTVIKLRKVILGFRVLFKTAKALNLPLLLII